MGKRKLTREQRVEIKDKYNAGGVTQTQLAEEYGVAYGTINRLLKYREQRVKELKLDRSEILHKRNNLGISVTDLAKEYHVSRETMERFLSKRRGAQKFIETHEPAIRSDLLKGMSFMELSKKYFIEQSLLQTHFVEEDLRPVKGKLRGKENEIRQAYALGTMTQSELAREYGVSRTAIYKIVHKQSYS